jgi:uncharacterized MAPEG superfamily protein
MFFLHLPYQKGELEMTIELTLLGWTFVLALVQILMVAQYRTRETGLRYNMGPRDTPGPAMGIITGRLHRAQNNLFETLPLFATAILIAHVAGREGPMTLWGAWMYFLGRVVYLPLYALGIPVLRTLTWVVSMLGLIMIIVAILRAG